MRAYDLRLSELPVDRSNKDHSGWVFGVPPGLAAHEWPLDPGTGYPLMHGFTLRLPEDHRVHGPEIVALSFFATAPDHNDGGPAGGFDLPKLLADHPSDAPSDPALAAVWKHAQVEHPRLHRLEDILGCHYAVILLTQDEYDGELCPVPEIASSPLFTDVPVAEWVSAKKSPQAILCTPRENDPNAGIPAVEFPEEGDAYTSPFDKDTYEDLDWAKDHAPDHIGGTMRQVQGVPEGFGAHYVGFEEEFGDYNFGGGNAQLDFENMKFDWACG